MMCMNHHIYSYTNEDKNVGVMQAGISCHALGHNASPKVKQKLFHGQVIA